jgi:hypothetical protein
MTNLPGSLTATACAAAVIATTIVASASGTAAQPPTPTGKAPPGCRGVTQLTGPGAASGLVPRDPSTDLVNTCTL